MEIKPKIGIDQILFGMRPNDVEALYGKPERQYKDEENHLIYLYFPLKLQLTFYADEAFRLGYLICADSATTFKGRTLIEKRVADAKSDLKMLGIAHWTSEYIDSVEHLLNEDNWITLQAEFGEVVKIELGADINYLTDEFEWAFKD